MDIMPNVHFNKGEVIFEEGYPAVAVYLVCEGTAEVFKKSGNEQFSLAKLNKDAIFGEMAFISDRPRSATVLASDDTWCYYLNKDVFLQKLETVDPIISAIFNDLVETIREKSNNAIFIDHGQIEPLDELEVIDQKQKVTPQHTLEYVTEDPNVVSKVDEMDFFMRKLYKSLVDIAYK